MCIILVQRATLICFQERPFFPFPECYSSYKYTAGFKGYKRADSELQKCYHISHKHITSMVITIINIHYTDCPSKWIHEGRKMRGEEGARTSKMAKRKPIRQWMGWCYVQKPQPAGVGGRSLENSFRYRISFTFMGFRHIKCRYQFSHSMGISVPGGGVRSCDLCVNGIANIRHIFRQFVLICGMFKRILCVVERCTKWLLSNVSTV